MAARIWPVTAAILVVLQLATAGSACARGADQRPGDGGSTAPATPSWPPAPSSPTPGALTPPPTPPAPPSPHPPAPALPFPRALVGQDVEHIPTDQRVVALTFDAGANGDALPSILATLASGQAHGTFFLTGDFARRYPQQARSITAAGHRLGNHSASHPHFPALTDAAIQEQITDAERDIRATAGADPRPLFRFPFGDRDTRTIGTVNHLGYLPVRWTVDTLGWQGTSGGRSAPEVTRRVLDTAQPGQIVLMHVGSHPTDGSTLDAEALPAVIAGLRERGYQFVTLDALLSG